MRGAARITRLLAALGVLGIAACLSPTLPLPPPEEPSFMTVGADGTWTVAGNCLSGAEVTVINEATGRGEVYVDRERAGHYTVQIEAEPCDVVIISQSLSEDDSGETRAVLQEVKDGLAVDPAACSP
ncbi:MAG: hypothetical protein HOV80_27380 [Polyangiaceae bacterium]|nr:hypothetical protein [Polyangiaceae bacterium]